MIRPGLLGRRERVPEVVLLLALAPRGPMLPGVQRAFGKTGRCADMTSSGLARARAHEISRLARIEGLDGGGAQGRMFVGDLFGETRYIDSPWENLRRGFCETS